MINDRQLIILWKEFLITKIIKTSALKIGMNRKTASKYLKQSTLPSESKKERIYKTRIDNLEKIWPKALELKKRSRNKSWVFI